MVSGTGIVANQAGWLAIILPMARGLWLTNCWNSLLLFSV